MKNPKALSVCLFFLHEKAKWSEIQFSMAPFPT